MLTWTAYSKKEAEHLSSLVFTDEIQIKCYSEEHNEFTYCDSYDQAVMFFDQEGQELYSYDKYKGYDIYINNPYEAGGDDNYEGFIYFNKTALEGYCLGKTGEDCLSKCKAWVDGLKEDEL